MSYVTILFSEIKEMHLTIANPDQLDRANDSSKIVGFFMPNGSFYVETVAYHSTHEVVSFLNGGSRG